MAKFKTKPASSALRLIVGLLLVSGLLRLGMVGIAIAQDGDALPAPSDKDEPVSIATSDADLAGLVALIEVRTKQLDEKEFALLSRQKDLEAAELIVKQNLDRLIAAEEKLAETLALVDGASENDLERLTTVYESMKPKVASALFEQMTPEFAAGFLGRMAPNAAAAIMSGLSSDTAYAISVVLAGRNATVPKE